MTHDHNKITINVGQMIKLQRLKQTENCESIILINSQQDLWARQSNHDKFITNVGWKVKYLSRIEYNV
jgi:hypothetical protein